MADYLAIAAAVVAGPLGAFALKGFQIWQEKTAARPSPATDTAAILAATATFQAALNVAADGIVARLEAQVEDLTRTCGQQAAKIAELETAHGECERRTLTLEGQLNTRGQQLESLARWFQSRGMDVPDLTGSRPLIILEPTLPGVA